MSLIDEKLNNALAVARDPVKLHFGPAKMYKSHNLVTRLGKQIFDLTKLERSCFLPCHASCIISGFIKKE